MQRKRGFFSYKDNTINLWLCVGGTISILFGAILGGSSWYVTILLGLGGSVLASGIVGLISALYIHEYEAVKTVSTDVGFNSMCLTRNDMNKSIAENMTRARHYLDYTAFGLTSLREQNESGVIHCLEQGVTIRIITVDPYHPILEDADRFEGKRADRTAESICDLCLWVEKLNAADYPGKIEIRYSPFAPREFYCRVDDSIFIGPYRFEKSSQQVITFKYQRPGDAFQDYSEYFEAIWKDKNYCREMPDLSERIRSSSESAEKQK